MAERTIERVVTHGHIFCGLGSGAAGFNDGEARVGNMVARFKCVGGIDVDPAGIRDFERFTGARGTVRDLFSLDQYMAFHGKPPPQGWQPALPADVSASFTARPNILFLSAPCKGFSGLLSETSSQTDKYQALNELTLRGMWLTLEAYQDDPIDLIIFENVPRIATRGRHLLDQISAMLRHYGYEVRETTHDCGELGGLAQSRKRFLLVARHRAKVPPYLYEPPKQRLRGVGEILDKMPLPGDPRAGPMHRMPALQWQTWVRLAFVEAGSDWRSLNKLEVADGILKDFGIMPEPMRNAGLGVIHYSSPAGAVIGESFPTNGRFAVADPRAVDADWNADVLGVRPWRSPTGAVAGRSTPTNGAFSVADPRHEHWGGGQAGVITWNDHAPTITSQRSPLQGAFSVADPREDAGRHHGSYGVRAYNEPAGVIAAATRPCNGTFSVADPRIDGHHKSVQLGVRPWDQPAAVVKGDVSVGTGPYAVSDPRVGQDGPRFSNAYRIVPYDAVGTAVTSAKGALAAVADPRGTPDRHVNGKYRVTAFDEPANAVIAGSTTGNGAYVVADPRGGPDPTALHGKHRVEIWDQPSRAVIAGRENGATAVADPRPTHGPNAHQNKMRVVDYATPSRVVTGSDRVGSGALSVADPRPICLNREGRETYLNQRHYGVTSWDDHTDAVPAFAKNNNGPWSVADPRPVGLNRDGREAKHVDHFGVLTWTQSSGAVIGSAHAWDNGRWSVADPRPLIPGGNSNALPAAKDRLVCVIRALDDTWHRPFTTLELAGLQSFFDPDEAFAWMRDGSAPKPFELDGKSDSAWRERIGNAVPRAAAKAIASTMGRTLLLAWSGETFMLSSDAIWVSPLEIALALDGGQAMGEILADDGRPN